MCIMLILYTKLIFEEENFHEFHESLPFIKILPLKVYLKRIYH